MWELGHKQCWTPKNWCFWTVVLEKTLESPLGCKEIQPINPKGSQSWIFIGRTDGEAEAPILWPPDGKNWFIGKDPDAGKDWRQEEKGMTEDEMVGWHHWFDGHEFEQAPGDGDGQGSLVCCCPQGHKELDTTERLSWTELISCKYNQNSTTLCHHHCYILVQDKFISLCFLVITSDLLSLLVSFPTACLPTLCIVAEIILFNNDAF